MSARAQIERARTERRAALDALNAQLPPGEAWRLYLDSERHVSTVRDAWTVGLVQASPDPAGPDGWSATLGRFVCIVAPMMDPDATEPPRSFRFAVSLGGPTGGPLPFLDACAAARAASAHLRAASGETERRAS